MSSFKLPLLAYTAICVNCANAQSLTLTCEHWNANLGRLPDKTYLIDFGNRTCRGEPCQISDSEFVWQMDAGSHEWRINRETGEGAHVALLGGGKSQEIDRFKNCRESKS
mgnify:CR=1 FL=1